MLRDPPSSVQTRANPAQGQPPDLLVAEDNALGIIAPAIAPLTRQTHGFPVANNGVRYSLGSTDRLFAYEISSAQKHWVSDVHPARPCSSSTKSLEKFWHLSS